MIFTEEGFRLLFCLAGTGLSAFLSSGPGCEVCTGGSSADVSRAQVAFPKMISGQGDSADQIRKGDRSLAACTVLYCAVLYCTGVTTVFSHSGIAGMPGCCCCSHRQDKCGALLPGRASQTELGLITAREQQYGSSFTKLSRHATQFCL